MRLAQWAYWPGPAACQSHYLLGFDAMRGAWLRLEEQARQSLPAGQVQIYSYAHPLRGPENDVLATDTLWLGDPDASQVIVLISGTHGVETYAGSAIQRELLQQLIAAAEQHAGSPAFLFVHALTPWGAAWSRRCDENGVDLNRHFIDFSALPDNANYARVRPWLFEADKQQRDRGLAQLARELGRRDYEIALSGGQHEDPSGPFFGGLSANHGRRVTFDLFDRYGLAQRDMVVLDLHTGLGPWGYGELICDHPPGSSGVETARRIFGAAVAEPALGTSASVPKSGLADYAWHDIMNAHSCYLTLEFGSYSTDQLFDCLIQDHQFWATKEPQADDAGWQPQRERLIEHFCPADPWWRHSVMLRGLQVIQQAFAGMS